MKAEEILDFPQVINNTHESCYRSFHILFKVIEMVNRGDSKETINETVEILNNVDKVKKKK